MPMDMMNTPMHSHTVLDAKFEVTSATVATFSATSTAMVHNTAAQSGTAREMMSTSMNTKQPRYCHAARLICSVSAGRYAMRTSAAIASTKPRSVLFVFLDIFVFSFMFIFN